MLKIACMAAQQLERNFEHALKAIFPSIALELTMQ